MDRVVQDIFQELTTLLPIATQHGRVVAGIQVKVFTRDPQGEATLYEMLYGEDLSDQVRSPEAE